MSHIIQVADLIDQKKRIHFGFEGFDLESKKLHYFSFIQNGIRYDNQLFEFKINNVPNTILNRPICFHGAPREDFSSSFPSELQFYKDTCIEKLASFNKSHSLPTTLLEKNKSFLSLQYNDSYEGCDFQTKEKIDEGDYLGFFNQIQLYINNEDWIQLNSNEKEQVYNVLLHELGHMEASRIFLNIRDNKLIDWVGFDSTEYFLIPIFLPNGDIFYKIDTGKTLMDSKKNILEEMINELKCKKISNTYKGVYPNYGEILNELCDKRLLMARYANGIEEYYERMTSIIPNESLATELLDLIVRYHNTSPDLETIFKSDPMLEKMFGTSRSSTEEEIQKLIRDYKIKKQKNKNL